CRPPAGLRLRHGPHRLHPLAVARKLDGLRRAILTGAIRVFRGARLRHRNQPVVHLPRQRPERRQLYTDDAVLFATSVNGTNACYIEFDRAGAWVALANDANTGWGPLGPLGTAVPALSNSQCSIDVQHSSTNQVGNDLYLNLAVTFASAFTGAKNVY